VVIVRGAKIVKLRAFEVPPPGPGLLTVTLAGPAETMSLAGMEAVSFVALLKVVVRSDPFQRTVALETKLEPLTVSVKAGPPAIAKFGLIPEIVGTGLLTVSVNSLLSLPAPGSASLTRTPNLKDPEEVGLPLNVPLLFKLSPGGKDPDLMVQV